MERIYAMTLDLYLLDNLESTRPPTRRFMWHHSSRQPLTQISNQLLGLCDRAETTTLRLAKVEEKHNRELERQKQPWWKQLFRA